MMDFLLTSTGFDLIRVEKAEKRVIQIKLMKLATISYSPHNKF